MRQLNSPAAPLLVRRWMTVPSNVAITTDVKAATAYRAYLLCVSVETKESLCLFTLWELGFLHSRMNRCTKHAKVGTLWPCACISSTLTVWAQNSSTAKRRIWTPHLQEKTDRKSERREKGTKTPFSVVHKCIWRLPAHRVSQQGNKQAHSSLYLHYSHPVNVDEKSYIFTHINIKLPLSQTHMYAHRCYGVDLPHGRTCPLIKDT